MVCCAEAAKFLRTTLRMTQRRTLAIRRCALFVVTDGKQYHSFAASYRDLGALARVRHS